MNGDHVQRLREEVLERGLDFTDKVEVYDGGFGKYWVGDGFHRLEAYHQAGRDKIRALVREGSERDAMIHAAGANTRHGLRRSREDTHRCIRLLLEDKHLAGLSDRTLAKLTDCDGKTVAAVREKLGLTLTSPTYTDKHGNETVMNVTALANRGKKRFASQGRANAFHDLPEPIRGVLRNFLQEASRLSKDLYSFARTWLGQLPPTPEEAGHLLLELDLEQASDEAEGEDAPSRR